jgi:dTDP-4-amino-4,6-dideoxygalactose transaminase
MSHVVKALAYYAMLRPGAYGVATRVPGLGLGLTLFTTDYPMAEPDPMLAALAATMLPRLEEFTAIRRQNAAALLALVRPVSGVRTIQASDRVRSACLRLPLLLESEQARDRVVATLTRAGYGATRSYPRSLVDVPELRPALAAAPSPMEGGRHVARTIVTLPTHPFVTADDIGRMGALLQTALSQLEVAALPAQAS